MKQKAVIVTAIVVIAAAVVINVNRLTSPYSAYGPAGDYSSSSYGDYGSPSPSKVTFRLVTDSNTKTQVPLGELTLLNEDLEPVRLTDVQGERNLLLVVLRGAPLCPFCTAQTSRLVSNYTKFRELGAEVVVIFPGTDKDLKQLLTNARLEDQALPFPVLVDKELSTIRRLDIEADKAMPSTFIIDRRGRTQFAYIGASLSDRPSIRSLVAALERIRPAETAGTDNTASQDSTAADTDTSG